MKSFFDLREKAVSQQQQKLMGLALAYKRGEVSDDEVSPETKKMADSMSTKDLEDFAKTKHKDLPKKVDEYGGPPISRKDYLKQKPMKENVEDDMPASPDEKSMALKQAEFIQYVGREIGEHLVANKAFPEWMQNKLSALHQKAKDMHATLGGHGDMDESVELDEAVKITHVLIDTADGNKVKAMASSEKEVMRSKNSAERPPMSVKDKNTLKVVKLKKPVSQKASEKMIGFPLNEEQKLFMFKTKPEAQKKAKEIRGKVLELGPKNFAVVTKDLTVVKEEVELGESRSFWDLREKRRNAGSDARRAMRDDPDFKSKGFKDVRATDDDRKAADKNIIVQLRRVSDLSKGGEVEFKNGKKAKVSQKDAKKLLKGFDGLRKGPDKERFQRMAGKDPAGLKRVMNLVK